MPSGLRPGNLRLPLARSGTGSRAFRPCGAWEAVTARIGVCCQMWAQTRYVAASMLHPRIRHKADTQTSVVYMCCSVEIERELFHHNPVRLSWTMFNYCPAKPLTKAEPIRQPGWEISDGSVTFGSGTQMLKYNKRCMCRWWTSPILFPEYIQIIMTLEESVQHVVMTAIQEVSPS